MAIYKVDSLTKPKWPTHSELYSKNTSQLNTSYIKQQDIAIQDAIKLLANSKL